MEIAEEYYHTSHLCLVPARGIAPVQLAGPGTDERRVGAALGVGGARPAPPAGDVGVGACAAGCGGWGCRPQASTSVVGVAVTLDDVWGGGGVCRRCGCGRQRRCLVELAGACSGRGSAYFCCALSDALAQHAGRVQRAARRARCVQRACVWRQRRGCWRGGQCVWSPFGAGVGVWRGGGRVASTAGCIHWARLLAAARDCPCAAHVVCRVLRRPGTR